MAQKINAELLLFHVAGKRASEEEVKDLERQLTMLAEEVVLNDCPWHIAVKRGSIFEDIGAFAEESSSGLIIMGTHGAKGSQKVFGSYALKVITNASTPFIITQEQYRLSDKVDNILIPIDLRNEDPRVLEASAVIAKALGSKIHILASWSSSRSKQNLSHQIAGYAESFFAERNIPTKVKFAPETASFDKYLIDYAQEVESDLIAIMNKGEEAYRTLFGKNFDQNIITNPYKIPVLTLDPHSSSMLQDLLGA